MFLAGYNNSVSKFEYVGNSQYLLLAFVIALLSLLPLPPLCSQPHFCLSQKAFSWLLDFCKISRKKGPLSSGLDYLHWKPSVGLYFNLNRTWSFERVYNKKKSHHLLKSPHTRVGVSKGNSPMTAHHFCKFGLCEEQRSLQIWHYMYKCIEYRAMLRKCSIHKREIHLPRKLPRVRVPLLAIAGSCDVNPNCKLITLQHQCN